MSDTNAVPQSPTDAADFEEDEPDDVCMVCHDGDCVPPSGYWVCPGCDREWNEADD